MNSSIPLLFPLPIGSFRLLLRYAQVIAGRNLPALLVPEVFGRAGRCQPSTFLNREFLYAFEWCAYAEGRCHVEKDSFIDEGDEGRCRVSVYRNEESSVRFRQTTGPNNHRGMHV